MAASQGFAQNVGNNAGIWWTPAAGQPGAFTFLNPLTTVYGRIGFLHAWQSGSPRPNNPLDPTTHSVGLATAPADAFGGVLGIGARLMPVLRYELQAGGVFNSPLRLDFINAAISPEYRRYEAHVSSIQILNNLYFDFAPFFGGFMGLNVYVMGGVGISFNTISDLNRNDPFAAPGARPGSGGTRTQFAWNAGVGAQWQPMRNLILDIGYRYVDAGRFDTSFQSTIGQIITWRGNLTSHQLMVSVVVPVDALARGFGN